MVSNRSLVHALCAILLMVHSSVHAQPLAAHSNAVVVNGQSLEPSAFIGNHAPRAVAAPLEQWAFAPDDGKFETVTGNILATIGAGMVGWYVGSKIADSETDASPALLVGGGALLVAGITFSSIGAKKKRKSLSGIDDRWRFGSMGLAHRAP